MDIAALKDQVASVFEAAGGQEEALERIYRLFFPGGTQTGGPACGDRLYRYLTALFAAFDYEHHPHRSPGQLWQEKGFIRDYSLPHWAVGRTESRPKEAGACSQ